ncbi:MAG: hypothetical protein KDE19_05740, partial [Caldilineaceae bacterium]|nr:hypothetical protein [Caldilineaceae bacterium]
MATYQQKHQQKHQQKQKKRSNQSQQGSRRTNHRHATAPAETGAVVKEWGGRMAVALTMPNTYYVGMS